RCCMQILLLSTCSVCIFDCSAAHRDLHSFPTRRSSDLEWTVDRALRRFHRQPRLARALWHLQQVGLGYLRLGQPATTLSGGEAQDRKSTRLNSSHDQISYAVFCLKKKKQSKLYSLLPHH